MSSTPPKNDGVEPAPQSPDDSEPHMDRDGQETQAQGLGYEFEVKEQDRWLPIANGASISPVSPGPLICACEPESERPTDELLHVRMLHCRASASSIRRITARYPPNLGHQTAALQTHHVVRFPTVELLAVPADPKARKLGCCFRC